MKVEGLVNALGNAAIPRPRCLVRDHGPRLLRRGSVIESSLFRRLATSPITPRDYRSVRRRLAPNRRLGVWVFYKQLLQSPRVVVQEVSGNDVMLRLVVR